MIFLGTKVQIEVSMLEEERQKYQYMIKCSNSEDEEAFNIITTQSIYYGVAGNETKETDLNYWTVK